MDSRFTLYALVNRFPLPFNNHFWRVIALFFIATGFAQTRQEIKEARERRDQYLFATKVSPQKFNETVKVEYVMDELLIPVVINGKTYHFIFDTGAITVLSKELAQELGLKSQTSNEIMDAAGVKTKQDIFMMDNLEIAGVKFRNVGCAAMSMDSFSTLLCKKVDGLLGTNIMKLGNWKIDYTHSAISFSSDKIKPDFDFETIKFEAGFSGSPFVSLVTGGIRFYAMIDSGNNRYIDVPDTIYKQSKLPKTAVTRKSYGRASYSLSGNNDQAEIAVLTDSLYFEEKLLRNQRLRISPSSQVLIGNSFLKQFGQIIISWDKSRMYIPKQTLPLEKEYAFGFIPFIENGKMVVIEVWDGSEAKNQGVAVNDIIRKVNDIDVTAITPEIWCEFYTKTKGMNQITVEFEKPDGIIQTIKLERFELLKPN